MEEVMDILKFYMNTILTVMCIQQFYNLICNWYYRKFEHIQHKAELPKISAINIELNPQKFTKVKIRNSNCKLCKPN